MRCEAITRGGGRCKLDATHGSYCWSHAPETSEARRKRGRQGGRAGGNGRPGAGEISEVRAALQELAEEVRGGAVSTRVGAVLVQIYNARTRLLETEMKVKEQRELEERLEQLEASLEQRGGESRWRRA